MWYLYLAVFAAGIIVGAVMLACYALCAVRKQEYKDK